MTQTPTATHSRGPRSRRLWHSAPINFIHQKITTPILAQRLLALNDAYSLPMPSDTELEFGVPYAEFEVSDVLARSLCIYIYIYSLT